MKWMSGRYGLASMASLCVFAGIAATGVPTPAEASVDSIRYINEEIVEGVVFATGPVAKDLRLDNRGIKDLPRETQQEVSRLADRIQKEMWAQGAHELDQAARDLTRGDPYLVRDTQIVLGERFEAALTAVEPS